MLVAEGAFDDTALVSKVSGMDMTELLSERSWSRIGAEQDAYMTADGVSTPFAGGSDHGHS